MWTRPVGCIRSSTPSAPALIGSSPRPTWSASFVWPLVRSGVSGRVRACGSCTDGSRPRSNERPTPMLTSQAGRSGPGRAGSGALAPASLGEPADARAYARESLALARERNDKRQIEWALRVLSFDEPHLDERRRLLHECEELLRELGNEGGLGWVTYLLGVTLFEEGRFDEARQTLDEAVSIFGGL